MVVNIYFGLIDQPGRVDMDNSNHPNLDRHIFLYGPPGSGKSTVGKSLADDLDLPFYDLDEIIVNHSGVDIPTLFAKEGEAGFRGREQVALEGVLQNKAGVVALGGGALLDPTSRSKVEANGRVLCLGAPVTILHSRLQASAGRPLLAGKSGSANHLSRLETLFTQRAEHYASFPLQLDTSDSSPEQLAWEAQVLMGRFRVSGMGMAYDVLVQAGGLGKLGELLRQRELRGPVALVSDENVGGIYSQQAIAALQSAGFSAQAISIPAGEKHKTIETATQLWGAFLSAGVERGSTVVALGGGLVGDLSGFAAATFLRGVRWVVLPTTTLAMVDASLGGKTGANLPHGKNLVGAFHPPSLVLADPETLSTLPEVEFRNGMAEVVKHGIIGDPHLFDLSSRSQADRKGDRSEVIRRAMAVKIKVIQEDPYEVGIRAALNLGHTIGHAVELASGYQLRHGEAVAIGMVAEARLAERMGLAEKGMSETIAMALKNLELPIHIPSHLNRETVLQAMRVDKKLARGEIRFSLPARIGEVKIGIIVDRLEEELCKLF